MRSIRMAAVIVVLGTHAAWADSPPASTVDRLPGFDPTAVDPRVDPCEDFYQYACGGWLASNPLPADRARWGRFDAVGEYSREIVRQLVAAAAEPRASRSRIEQQVGDYYASCVDFEALNALGTGPIEAELRRVDALRERREVPALLARMHRAGAAALFVPYSARDFESSERFILTLAEGELGLPSREYYLRDDADSARLRRELVEHAATLLELAGASPEAAQEQAAQVLDVDTRLAAAMLSLTARLDPHQRHHRVARDGLLESHPRLAFEEYLRRLGAGEVTEANVVNPRHLRAVDELVATLPLEALKTYLKWHWLREAAPFLSAPFIHEHDRFHQQVLGGQRATLPRDKQCTRFVEMDLSHPVGQLYVERAFGAAQKERVERMSREIRAAFSREIEKLPWMTPATRRAALTKLAAMTEKIGYPDRWRDYSGLRVVRGDALGNSLRANEHELQHQLERIARGESDEWLMAASVANAYYYNSANEIAFPAGILQPPFYDHELDDAVNYGTLGTVIGHEITHGFDSAGRGFDAEGNLRDWWQPADAAAFEERAACFSEQYSEYAAGPGVPVDGELTLGENIADHGGMRIALEALLRVIDVEAPRIDGYTPLQRFFLANAQTFCANLSPEEARRRALTDTHAPNRWRVNGVVSSFPELAAAFECPASSAMVRASRCRIW